MSWRKINGFPRYSVSDEGQVRNDLTGRILKTQPDRFGYLRLGLSNENGRSKKYLHRLVAETFVPNSGGKPEVNHKDGNKLNCSASNLEWVTAHENRLHMYRELGVAPNHPSKEHLAMIQEKAKEARAKPVRCVEVGVAYDSVRSAASAYGITGSAITHALKSNSTAAGYHWEIVSKEEDGNG